MERDYSELLDHAANLQTYDGYLDTNDLKQRQEIEARFTTARNKFVYALLREGGNWQDISRSVSDDLDQIESVSDPSWQAPIALVRENLLTRIEKEAAKSPWLRTVVRWTPVALGVTAVVAYFGVRLVSSIEVSQPIETRAGLEQRAAAAEKAIRYDEAMTGPTGLRRGLLAQLVFWPIEPSHAEIRAAQDFAALTLEGHSSLVAQGEICGDLPQGAGDTLSDRQIDLIGDVAAHLRDAGIQWRDPPVMTVLDPIRRLFPC